MPTSTESTHHSNPESNHSGQPTPTKVVAPAPHGAPSGDGDVHGPVNGEHSARHSGLPPPAPAASSPDRDKAPPLPHELTAPEGPHRSAVRIRGRLGGVALEIDEGEWEALIALLQERLIAANGFFRGGRVMLDVGRRVLDEQHLRQVSRILEEHEMRLAVVGSTAEATIKAALALGVPTTADIEHGELPAATAPSAPRLPQPATEPAPPLHIPDPTPPRPQDYVHRGSLRSGQVLRKTESIVIIGDVNPGAQVISGGDIMVWGRLRGIAHAGADGNRRAVVAALDFVPTQLRIAKLTTIPPEQQRSRGLFFWRKQAARRPEIARILDGKIIVEPWDETRTYGTSALRR